MDHLLTSNTPAARIWVFSDLQQRSPDKAEDCMNIALGDMRELDFDLDGIWYLGDAVEGMNRERLQTMIDMQISKLSALGVPLRFVMGNHDLDCSCRAPSGKKPPLPVWEAFRNVPNWKTTAACNDFYFTDTYGDVLTVFLSDHVAPDNRWVATQQEIRGQNPESYDIPQKVFSDLRAYIADWKGPVVLAGHYAFPGGAREPPARGWLNRLLPLPDNVKLVLHGHAHIGDWSCAQAETFQRVTWMKWHNIPQANVSSLDRNRGSQTRSVLFDIYKDGTFGLFFRDHEDRRWTEAFFTDTHAPRTRTATSAQYQKDHPRPENEILNTWLSQHP